MVLGGGGREVEEGRGEEGRRGEGGGRGRRREGGGGGMVDHSIIVKVNIMMLSTVSWYRHAKFAAIPLDGGYN